MPVKLFKPKRMPERIKRHIALRDLAELQADAKGKTLTKGAANAAAKELSKDTLPHTKAYWDNVIRPDYE